MKAVVLSDIHIGVHKDSEPWLSQTRSLFNNIADTCIRESINTIIVAGDMFHERKFLNIQTMCRTMEIMLGLHQFRFLLLVGNHDTYYKHIVWPHSLFIFNELPNVQIISEPTVIEDLLFLPWSTKPYSFSDYKEKIVVGHFEIDGFPATCSDNFVGGYKTKDFTQFDLVISGHFHVPCRRTNILYCGSPFHLTASDRGSKCGYYILNGSDIHQIENPDYARFIRITTEDKVTRELIEGNIVELLYTKDYGSLGNVRRMEYIQSLNPMRLTTNFTNVSICQMDPQKQDQVEIITKSNRDILKEYIDTIHVPKHIRKAVLNGIVDKLLKEIGT